MQQVTVTPNHTYGVGAAKHTLWQISGGPVTENADGTLTAQMTPQQIALLRMRAPMHGISVEDPPAPVDPVKAWQDATECQTPTEFEQNFVEFRGEVERRMADVAASIVLSWQDATGCETPADAKAARLDAQQKLERWKAVTGCGSPAGFAEKHKENA